MPSTIYGCMQSFALQNRIAMEIKKSPQQNLESKKLILRQIGAILALALVFFAFEYKNDGVNSMVEVDRWFKSSPVEEVLITIQPKPLPPPPPPQPVVKITTTDNLSENVPDIVIDASIDDKERLINYYPVMPSEESDDERDLHFIVEKMPEFPGGIAAMMHYFNKSIRYPLAAREQNIQGRVFLTFVVEMDGSITNVEVLRGIGGGCDEEAVRVVQEMPNWNPGIQNGKAVRVSFNLPVRFGLR